MADFTFNRKTYKPGEMIFCEGDHGDVMYYVKRGKVRIWRGTGDNPQVLGYIDEGGIFGEMALIDGAPRMAHATAVDETLLHAIPEKVLKGKLEAADPFVSALVRILTKNLRSSSA